MSRNKTHGVQRNYHRAREAGTNLTAAKLDEFAETPLKEAAQIVFALGSIPVETRLRNEIKRVFHREPDEMLGSDGAYDAQCVIDGYRFALSEGQLYFMDKCLACGDFRWAAEIDSFFYFARMLAHRDLTARSLAGEDDEERIYGCCQTCKSLLEKRQLHRVKTAVREKFGIEEDVEKDALKDALRDLERRRSFA